MQESISAEYDEGEKKYYGAITVFFKDTPEGRRFLVAKNAETPTISFVSGAKEKGDATLQDTAQREIEEEIGLASDAYELQQLDVTHEFTFGPQKKNRAGSKGSYQVFYADISAYTNNIQHTKELQGTAWLSAEEMLQQLTFPDVKEVFEKALTQLPPQ